MKATHRAVGLAPWRERLATDGYTIVPNVIDSASLEVLREAFDDEPVTTARRGGRRNVLDLPSVRTLALYPALRSLVDSVLGPMSLAVRGVLFDKTPRANWRVIWHQDLTVAVASRRDVPGFGPWTVKAGVAHCLAPAQVLERMLAVRVHLDDCGPDDGPLRILLGSHGSGRLNDAAIRDYRARIAPVDCVADAGGVVLMRPLLLHASSSARRLGRRRVLHLEFANVDLPAGLAWATGGVTAEGSCGSVHAFGEIRPRVTDVVRECPSK